MLKSMTAFARVEQDVSGGSLIWEIRSVNHRYLESNLKLPDHLREVEPKLRTLMRQHLSRGKLDGILKWQPAFTQTQNVQINEQVLKALSSAQAQLASHFDNLSPIDPLALLQWPGVIDAQSEDLPIRVYTKSVQDFEVLGSSIWIATEEGILSFNTQTLDPEPLELPRAIQGVHVENFALQPNQVLWMTSGQNLYSLSIQEAFYAQLRITQ